MHTTPSLATHALPFWFLVVSLFIPRIALLVWWIGDHAVHTLNGFVLAVGLVPLIIAILVPRILILFLIYNDQGLSLWFLIHVVALLLAWGGLGTHQYRRRWRDDV